MRTRAHPGEILREEFMKPLGLSANALALALRVPVTRVNDIARERRGVGADTALRSLLDFEITPVLVRLQHNNIKMLTIRIDCQPSSISD